MKERLTLRQRPGLRPMRALPLLEGDRAALEKCVFCPKLCRSACPVSNAEPRETVTPWGKMSLSWMAAHGDVPADGSHAAPAWACTGCFACRESCDHRNPVADVLLDSRDAFVKAGSAPGGAWRVLSTFARHEARSRAKARALATAHPEANPAAKTALLIGCAYVRGAPREARHAVDAASALLGSPVAVIEGCCGLPLRLVGDKNAFAVHAREFARTFEGKDRVVVVDAGCAFAIRRRYDEIGVDVRPRIDTLVELAAERLASLHPANAGVPVRWHDPCQLGRGLGLYDTPRAVLTRIFGRAPNEFVEARERGACAGAGGLLPSTMPEVAAEIARARMSEHTRAGGGRVVTGCAASLMALRKAAAGSVATVEDIVSIVAAAVR